METARLTRVQRVALFAGAFLGPFGGLMTSSILPELGASYGISPEEASVSIMVYLLPFAATMLVSGSISARWGIRRMMTTAYVVITAAGVLCAVAPSWYVFLAGYFVLGVSNAFTNPLIVTLLSRFTAADRLGRTLGIFGAVAATGQLSAPLVSGLFAELTWRYAFIFVAAYALLLCTVRLPWIPTQQRQSGSRTLTWPIVWLCVTNLTIGACVTGLGFLVALFAYDNLGSSASERGIILMIGGVSSLVVAPLAGAAVDRWGSRTVSLAALLISASFILAVPLATNPLMLAVLWAVSIPCALAVALSINKHVLGLRSADSAISFVQAFRFFGAGVAPMVLMPIYLWQNAWGFIVAAIVLLATILLHLVARPFDSERVTVTEPG